MQASRPEGTAARPQPTKPGDSVQTAIIAFCIFAFVNSLSAIHAPIQDCDEVFNYWEPTHYLNNGFGLQTWEYSPGYAIRSWVYILLHAIPAEIGSFMVSKRSHEFYFVRSVLALCCAGAEAYLFHAIVMAYNFIPAFTFLIAMITSPGMFHASVAYLPSSFAMYTSMMGLAVFINKSRGMRTREGIMWFGIGSTLGWPFSAALILPLFENELNYLWLDGGLREVATRVFEGVFRTSIIIVRAVSTKILFWSITHHLSLYKWP